MSLSKHRSRISRRDLQNKIVQPCLVLLSNNSSTRVWLMLTTRRERRRMQVKRNGAEEKKSIRISTHKDALANLLCKLNLSTIT